MNNPKLFVTLRHRFLETEEIDDNHETEKSTEESEENEKSE